MKVRRPLAILSRLRMREVAIFFGGIAVAAAVTVAAETVTQTAAAENCPLNTAAQNAINSKITMIGATSPDPSKYFTIGGSQSCLGNIALTKIDLSQLIPDIYGAVSNALVAAFEKIMNSALAKACTAGRGSMNGIITQWNSAVSAENGSVVTTAINKDIGTQTTDLMNKNSLSWSTSNAPAVTDLVSTTGSVGIPALTAQANVTNVVNSVTQSATNAGAYTTAMANQESARVSLQQAQAAAVANPTSAQVQAQLQQAQATYNSAVAATTAAKNQPVTSDSTATGSAVFP